MTSPSSVTFQVSQFGCFSYASRSVPFVVSSRNFVHFFNEDIIGDIFFPPATPGDNENLIKTFAIFGGAFVMRPVGGLLIVSSVVRKKWAIWYC